MVPHLRRLPERVKKRRVTAFRGSRSTISKRTKKRKYFIIYAFDLGYNNTLV
jgi:hypothetical protein